MNEIRLRSAACVSSTWRNEYLSDVLRQSALRVRRRQPIRIVECLHPRLHVTSA